MDSVVQSLDSFLDAGSKHGRWLIFEASTRKCTVVRGQLLASAQQSDNMGFAEEKKGK